MIVMMMAKKDDDNDDDYHDVKPKVQLYRLQLTSPLILNLYNCRHM